MRISRYALMTTFILAVFLLAASAWAGGPPRGGHHGNDSRYSYSLGLNVAYPPYRRGHGPRYYPRYPAPYPRGYGYYPRYPYAPYYGPAYGPAYGPGYGSAYGPSYGGRIGFGYSSGYHDSYSLFFSLPLYLGPSPTPVAAPVLQATRLVPEAARQAPQSCLQRREYQTEIVIDGRTVPAYGTACLQADGSWKVISGPFAAE